MANHFNLNDNKKCLGDEFSQTTPSGGFSNDAMTLNYNGVSDFTTTPTPKTFTVTFNNANNSGGTSTYTAQPFETIGHAIDEKKLSLADHTPHYRYNDNLVFVDTIIPITSDIEIDVTWEDLTA